MPEPLHVHATHPGTCGIVLLIQVNVTFNGEQVPGSPFTCTVLDTDSVVLTGDGLHSAPANVTTSFRVDPKGVGDFDIRAWVVCKLNLKLLPPLR